MNARTIRVISLLFLIIGAIFFPVPVASKCEVTNDVLPPDTATWFCAHEPMGVEVTPKTTKIWVNLFPMTEEGKPTMNGMPYDRSSVIIISPTGYILAISAPPCSNARGSICLSIRMFRFWWSQ